MSLFIAGLAYKPAMLDAAKLGILGASVVSAAFGLTALTWIARGRQTHELSALRAEGVVG
jgi:NhaA family Na+:H+ antiporter